LVSFLSRKAMEEGVLNELALFAGAGGGLLGSHLLGWRCVCAVENNPYAAGVLLQRQNDRLLPSFPIWDDVCTFDGRPWKGVVDVVSGGFPCQDISAAGKGKGISGEKSGLWNQMARIVEEVQPKFVWIENSPFLRTRGLVTVLQDLAEMGFDAEWGVVGAHHVDAPHKRDRMWVLAYPDSKRRSQPQGSICKKRGRVGDGSKEMADSAGEGLERIAGKRVPRTRGASIKSAGGSWWESEPDVGRVANGVAARVDRLKALGNGQVPEVVRLAWHLLNLGAPKELL
jgi:DNA (cytosine-5)-methyltransferase 1